MPAGGLSSTALKNLSETCSALAGWITQQRDAQAGQGAGSYILGMVGPQGCGKTTLCRFLTEELSGQGISAVAFSLDDLYLTHAERTELKRACPHYRFRGLYGTHDIALGLGVLEALQRCSPESPALIPVFDKSLHAGDGDRLPQSAWHSVTMPPEVIILEGWCLGGRPVSEDELLMPICSLESNPEYDDAQGSFRSRINHELAAYQPLFNAIHGLVVLQPRDVSCIYRWREQQEQELRNTTGSGMEPARVRDFIDYFMPTYIRYIQPLAEPRSGADLIIRIGHDHAMQLVGPGQALNGAQADSS